MNGPANHVLETDRLRLSPIQAGDEELLWPHVADERITQFMAWDPHPDQKRTREFVNAERSRLAEDRGITWMILEGDTFCGIISLIALQRTHRSLVYNKAELAYWLCPECQGRGLMTEAAEAVIGFCEQELGLNKLCVSHFGPNAASERLIKRLGFRCVGTQQREFCKAGTWYDHVLYEKLLTPPAAD